MTRLKHTLTYALILALALAWPASAVRDGNGGYSLPSNPFSEPASGGTLTASDAEAVWSDIETAIAGSLATDGQSTMAGAIKMGANKITGLAVGTANTDGVTLGQVQNSGMKWGGVAGGTADALTISVSPALTAYADGQTFCFVSSASPNTGAATLNINSVGAAAIQQNGAALVAGAIAASKVYCVVRYNSLFHLFSPLAFTKLFDTANTFTAAQTISLTAAGTALTVTSTDAGAAEGPTVALIRDSASPAANDIIGAVRFDGEDSGGASQNYGIVRGRIDDPTAASEDGSVEIATTVAGTAAVRVTIGQGVQVGAPTGGDQGVGTINADNGIFKDGVLVSSGTIQTVLARTTTSGSTASTIPDDNTVPQITEGAATGLSQAFTPRSAASTIIITVSVHLAHASSNVQAIAALFKDSGANALAAGIMETQATHGNVLTFTFSEASGSTTARTYSVRYGSNTGTTFINRETGGDVLGGRLGSTMLIQEVL